MTMNTGAGPSQLPAGIDELRPWAECDFFCIHDYAGTGPHPCGWRGRQRDARHDETGSRLVCPRCGSATLLRIRVERDDLPRA
jgi:hypothetical protein